MKSIADQFKEKIEKGDMPQPIPKWRVQAQHTVLWILFVFFVAIGAASSGVALWFISDPNGLLREYNNGSFLSQVLDALPLFWILLSLLLAVGAIAVFVHAPRGYRYRTPVIGGTVILAFIAFGGAISATGMSDKIEYAAAKMPGYNLILKPRINNFIKMEEGRIMGRIMETEAKTIILQDPRGNSWQVDITNCSAGLPMDPKESKCVRVIGVPSSTVNFFEAKSIVPCPRGVRIQTVEQYLKQRVKEPVR